MSNRDLDYVFGVNKSSSNSAWIKFNSILDNHKELLKQKYNLSEVLSTLILNREISIDEIDNFINPKIENLMPDPSKMKDMDKTVKRLIYSIENDETIGIFGDYDVDGATSAAMISSYLEYCGCNTFIHIPDRFLEGYGWNGEHHRPEMDIVSLYVDQVEPKPSEGADESSMRYDLSQERAERFPEMKIYPTVADALTLGTNDLKIDGVLLVAEHGDYQRNEKGQHQYPRYELFKQIVSVYRTTGKTAPVFNDKHLSWNWDWCQEMYDLSQELNFAFMAGSSLPVTWRTPSLEMPINSEIDEAVGVCYGGVDSYDYHGLETIQCMVERRKGGECGVKWLKAYRGESFWQALSDGVWSRELMYACLSRSHTLKQARPGFNNVFPTVDEMKSLCEDPVAFVYEHKDRLKRHLLG